MAALTVLLGALLSAVYWPMLWLGGGLIGGDLFPYFLPQKTYLQSRLLDGEFPLWNPLTGHGYPLIAESQTGALYLPTLLSLMFLKVTTAYNVVQLTHYVAAFAATTACTRRWGATWGAAWFASLVYVYAWYAPRICLEWAAIGAPYLPAMLYLVDAFLESGRRRWLFGFLLIIAMQLTAGHFNLAFLFLLTSTAFAAWRLITRTASSPGVTNNPAQQNAAETRLRRSIPAATSLMAAVLSGYLLAAVQLVPSYELKSLSQRKTAERAFSIGYGHIPPGYLLHVAAPWMFFRSDIDLDQLLTKIPAACRAGTNRVEAHMYFGMAPLGLAMAAGAVFLVGKLGSRRDIVPGVSPESSVPTSTSPTGFWLVLTLAAMAVTPGWFTPLWQHLPGFSFFSGPGRYGVLATWGVAMLASSLADRCVRRWSGMSRFAVWTALSLGTVYDLQCVLPHVNYCYPMWAQLTDLAERSRVQPLLAGDEAEHGRVFSPGMNIVTILGASGSPPYLGIGPEQYFDPKFRPPQRSTDAAPWSYSEAEIDWMRRSGMRHLIAFEPAKAPSGSLSLAYDQADPFLNLAWGRRGEEPLFIYKVAGARKRAFWADPESVGGAKIVELKANRVVIHTSNPSEDRLVLADLVYPGWTVTIDDRPAEAETFEGWFRAVRVPSGEHRVTWQYRPRSFAIGLAISLITGLVLTVLAVRSWRANRRPIETGSRISTVMIMLAAGLVAMSQRPSRAEDRVVVRTPRGGRIAMDATIIDYSSRGLTVRLRQGTGSTREYALDDVIEATTSYRAEHLRGIEKLAGGRPREADVDFAAAEKLDSRAWVRRELTVARLRCDLWTGDRLAAGRRAMVLLDRDPTPLAVRSLPFNWGHVETDDALAAAAEEWIDRQPAVAQLLAASWLLRRPDRRDAMETLVRRYSSDANPVVRHLAQSLQWRIRLDEGNVSSDEVERWEAAFHRVGERWRGGEAIILGDAWSRLGNRDLAVAYWLRIPYGVADDRPLAATMLLRSAQTLHESNDWNSSFTLLREVAERYADTPSAAPAAALMATLSQR